MSHTAMTAAISLLCTGAMLALLAASGARSVDLFLVSAFAGLMAAACAIAALSSHAVEEEPCNRPSA
jgi:hypothetical protein